MSLRLLWIGFWLAGSFLLRAQTGPSLAFTNIAAFLAQARTSPPIQAEISGTVTYSYRESSLYIQDTSAGLFVSSRTNPPVRPGDVVRVRGVSRGGGFSPVLDELSLERLGTGPLPKAVEATAQEIMKGRHDMELVHVRGTLLEVLKRPDQTVFLRLLSGTVPFTAELDIPEIPAEWTMLLPQAEVDVTGICTIGSDRNGYVRSFRLLLRDPSDVAVLKAPPWWTFERTLRVVVLLGVLMLAGLIWVAALNHQVRQQTRELRARFEREAALEDQYHDLFENAEELVFMLEPNASFASMNKATEKTLGVSRFEVIGKSFADFILPEQRARFQQFIQDAFRQSSSGLGEFIVRNGRGQDVHLEMSCHLMNRPRVPSQLQVIARDVTERKRAEAEINRLNQFLEKRVAERTAQLAAANKELEAFSYSVSHDLRAPLRAIDGFSRILLEENLGQADEETRTLLEGIHKNARKMAQLIDDLLQFSRLTRSSLNASEVNLTQLFRTAFEEQKALQPDRKIELVMAPLPPVKGDLPMLRQVVENLVSNAIKYTRQREVARIEAGHKAENGEDIFWVKDNGVGFDMRYADKLFKVFQRLHTEREFEGTGVGLAIVQRVIARHHGRVWADARPGEGATIYFSLPKEAEWQQNENRPGDPPVERSEEQSPEHSRPDNSGGIPGTARETRAFPGRRG